MKRRKAKRFSEDLIREMLELYTMRPPFRIRKKKKEPDKSENEAKARKPEI
jgi:hypothetical protein